MIDVRPVGIRSLAVAFPRAIRTNGYWQDQFPELFDKTTPNRVRVPRKLAADFYPNGFNIWSQEVAPYLSDPFRGSVERRVLASEESSLMLEYQAAKDVLEAAQMLPAEVELVVVASLMSDRVGTGNAAYLARRLGIDAPAWNLESTCSSALVALQNAKALIQVGEYRNALVVVSQAGSRSVDSQDTLSFSMGDGAGAFLVDTLKPEQGILGSKVIHTHATCDAYLHELVINDEGKPWMRTQSGNDASTLAETAVDFVRTCCQGAVATAGLSLDHIDLFAFNTPTAWYASVCARALGIAPERTINLYPRYANIGPVFPIANLYHVAQSEQLKENDLVLVYTNGAGATAAAMVMRWGDASLGLVPAAPIDATLVEQENICLARAQACSVGSASIEEAESLSKGKILKITPIKRKEFLEAYLLGWLADVLQISENQLAPQQPFASLVDSLMAFTFRSKIEADLGLRIPIEKFLGESNVKQLAEFILNQLVLVDLVAPRSAYGIIDNKNEREKITL